MMNASIHFLTIYLGIRSDRFCNCILSAMTNGNFCHSSAFIFKIGMEWCMASSFHVFAMQLCWQRKETYRNHVVHNVRRSRWAWNNQIYYECKKRIKNTCTKMTSNRNSFCYFYYYIVPFFEPDSFAIFRLSFRIFLMCCLYVCVCLHIFPLLLPYYWIAYIISNITHCWILCCSSFVMHTFLFFFFLQIIEMLHMNRIPQIIFRLRWIAMKILTTIAY